MYVFPYLTGLTQGIKWAPQMAILAAKQKAVFPGMDSKGLGHNHSLRLPS